MAVRVAVVLLALGLGIIAAVFLLLPEKPPVGGGRTEIPPDDTEWSWMNRMLMEELEAAYKGVPVEDWPDSVDRRNYLKARAIRAEIRARRPDLACDR